MNDSRNNIVKFRVSDEEFAILQNKTELANCKNMSDFLRRISLGGNIYNVDTTEFSEMRKLIKSISDNINQIAKAVNVTKSVYNDDIEEIKGKVNEIWQQQAYILSLLHRLER